jgi:hypothetical protein
MALLESIGEKDKKLILGDILGTCINPFAGGISRADIDRGIDKMTGDGKKIDDLLRMALKTSTLDMPARAVKIAIISERIGADAAINDEMLDLLFTEPCKADAATLFLLALLANRKVTKKTAIKEL